MSTSFTFQDHLVIATYAITLLGIVVGFVTALAAITASKRTKAFQNFKNDIELKYKEFRDEVYPKILTADRIMLVHEVLNTYISASSVGEISETNVLSQYHKLYSKLTKLVSSQTSEEIKEVLFYLGAMVGCFGRNFDSSMSNLLVLLWCEKYFHRAGVADDFRVWYDQVFGNDSVPLPDLRWINT